MQKWKKIMSALLVTGMLMTAGAGLALADTAEASAPERPAGPKGGLLLNEEWLTEQIAGLSAEQQAEILALQEQLAARAARTNVRIGAAIRAGGVSGADPG